MKTPFFSIIIPTYNRAALIGKTIRTVLQQSFTDFEILLIDDGSTDSTPEVVKEIQDPRVFYFRKENAERGAARNYGAARAKGLFLNFFDSDDLMYSHHLETAYRCIQQWNHPEWLHLGYDSKNEKGELLFAESSFSQSIQKQLLFDNRLSCNGVLIRKDIAREFPFQEMRALASSEDWELWIRLASRFPLRFSNEITTTVVIHDMRSLNTIGSEKVVSRDLLMIAKLEGDEKVKAYFGKTFSRFKAERYTFFMLKFAEERKKGKVWHWAMEAMKHHFSVIFTKRFLASLKNSLRE